MSQAIFVHADQDKQEQALYYCKFLERFDVTVSVGTHYRSQICILYSADAIFSSRYMRTLFVILMH